MSKDTVVNQTESEGNNETLVKHSFCIAEYDITNLTNAPRSDFAPPDLSRLIDHINTQSSIYTLYPFNCWWFADCVFRSIAAHVGSRRLTAHQSVATFERREVTLNDALAFCDAYYVLGHRPYWIIVGYIPLLLAAMTASHWTGAAFYGLVWSSLVVDILSVYNLVWNRDSRRMGSVIVKD